MMEMRLLILFSVVVALTSAQTVTVGGNLTNTISNSGNSFKPLSKNSGNVFKNQYHVSVGPEKEVKDREEDEMTKGKDDVIGQLNLLQRVLATSILAFILFLLIENYIWRSDKPMNKDGQHLLFRRDISHIQQASLSNDWLYRPRMPDSVWSVESAPKYIWQIGEDFS